MKRVFLNYLFLCSMLGNILAQEITGKVLEQETSEPLIGVSVSVENSTKGTITGLDGSYSVPAKKGDVLVFSYIGMITQKVTVQNEKVINVHLSQNENMLEELVVVGYGTMTKEDLTGAISSLKGKDI